VASKNGAGKKVKPTQRGKPPASAAQMGLNASTVYAHFMRWQNKSIPKWHPIKKMRYVFWRMIGGSTVGDAIRELHWQEAEFWHLVDLKRHAPFREEYKRAKILQGRALADSVQTIAEGRDAITRKHLRETQKIIQRAITKISRQKSMLHGKMILESVLGDLRERDKIVMTRNKLQIEAAKWLAGTSNPAEYGPKSALALGGPSDGDGSGAPRPVLVQFIGPDGKVVVI